VVTDRASAVRVGLVYPELLGTYGDRGNALVLVERCRRRGVAAELVVVPAGEAVPAGLDVYVLGGGEDDPQEAAAAGLRQGRAAIDRAVAHGAVVFAVCAGFQLCGTTYTTGGGRRVDGLGLLEATTEAGTPRCIGEVVSDATATLGVGLLTGFENHAGRTRLGPETTPLGRVLVGAGNGVGGVDGAVRDRVVGTYLHGPVLPRNPALADRLLEWVIGPAVRHAVADRWGEALHAERLREARLRGLRAWWRDRRLARG
jgi:CobQ-like glutamine amidotransferase family enzyme